MLPKNDLVNDFLELDINAYKFPLVTVYFNPTDFPDKYVARLFDLQQATDKVMVKDTLEEIHDGLTSYWVSQPRDKNDDPKILEVWF